MQRTLVALYGISAYALAVLALAMSLAFVGDMFVNKTIDRGSEAPIGEAVAINTLLLGLFAVQHSGMARKAFKRWLTAFLPPAAERSTYVLASALILFLLVWQWRPIPDVVWSVSSEPGYSLLMALFWLGWIILFLSTWMIDHFDLFGLKQVYNNWRNTQPADAAFATPFLYRFVRHPIYLGLLLAFWSTPRMTQGHLLFAGLSTAYIFIGIWFEERDLVAQFGDAYRDYRRRVPMILPWPKGKQ
jgi:methanethiol S-methyltransferase